MIFLNIFNQMSADLFESGLNETELKILDFENFYLINII